MAERIGSLLPAINPALIFSLRVRKGLLITLIEANLLLNGLEKRGKNVHVMQIWFRLNNAPDFCCCFMRRWCTQIYIIHLGMRGIHGEIQGRKMQQIQDEWKNNDQNINLTYLNLSRDGIIFKYSKTGGDISNDSK